MSYIDIQIEKCLKRLRDHLRKTKKLDGDRVRVYLYKLTNDAYHEGIYANKPKVIKR